ncbi:hypothetical protein Lser_V15G01985 [Lactuca serriola]
MAYLFQLRSRKTMSHFQRNLTIDHQMMLKYITIQPDTSIRSICTKSEKLEDKSEKLEDKSEKLEVESNIAEDIGKELRDQNLRDAQKMLDQQIIDQIKGRRDEGWNGAKKDIVYDQLQRMNTERLFEMVDEEQWAEYEAKKEAEKAKHEAEKGTPTNKK